MHEFVWNTRCVHVVLNTLNSFVILYCIIKISILCVRRVLGQININWMFLSFSLPHNHDLGALLNRKFLFLAIYMFIPYIYSFALTLSFLCNAFVFGFVLFLLTDLFIWISIALYCIQIYFTLDVIYIYKAISTRFQRWCQPHIVTAIRGEN